MCIFTEVNPFDPSSTRLVQIFFKTWTEKNPEKSSRFQLYPGQITLRADDPGKVLELHGLTRPRVEVLADSRGFSWLKGLNMTYLGPVPQLGVILRVLTGSHRYQQE